jgi:hypothetical protein
MDERCGGRIQGREVEQAQVAAELLVAADALVVVDEIAAAVENELVATRASRCAR